MDCKSIRGHFLVNGRKAQVTLDASAISWLSPADGRRKSGDADAGKLKQIQLRQVIGARLVGQPEVGSSPLARRHQQRLKVYYAKQCADRSAGRLLRLKKLTVTRLAPSGRNQEEPAEELRCQTDEQRQQIGASNPPSCYASEGSSSQLSSLTSDSDRSSPLQVWQPAASSLERLAQQLEASIERLRAAEARPRRLLVFVNPFGGKGRASHLYKSRVRRLLELAGVEAKLVVTKHANHARHTIEDPSFDVEHFDGLVCVGGDGMFSELMNGLLFRYNRDQILATGNGAPPSPPPGDTSPTDEQHIGGAGAGQPDDDNGIASLTSDQYQDGDQQHQADSAPESSEGHQASAGDAHDGPRQPEANSAAGEGKQRRHGQFEALRRALGGIGKQFIRPPVPIGVIGAGSTDANSFGLIGTNDVITATLNIILGNQIDIDVCSIHSFREDSLLRFVSTFVAYGYFGDVIRESEKFRWLGPSRYDLTGVNSLLRNRTYDGLVKILRSSQDGSPSDLQRCHNNCELCAKCAQNQDRHQQPNDLELVEQQGPFVGVNAAVTACRCPQTRKGFSPNNHLANGCADLILVKPCSRVQYIQYLLRTGWTKKSAFDLKYVDAYRCRQFEFVARANHQQEPAPMNLSDTNKPKSASKSTCSLSTGASDSNDTTGSNSNSLESNSSQSSEAGCGLASSWNADGEILDEQSIRVKVNNQLLRVFGTGEPDL